MIRLGPSSLGIDHRERGYFDGWMALAVAALLIVGLMALYSQGMGRPGQGVFPKQLMFLAIGGVPFAAFFFIDPPLWRKTTGVMYILNLALLALVLIAGSSGGGAQRWLNIGPMQFQPSEMSKLVAVLTLATYYADRTDRVTTLGTYVGSLLYILPSLVMVFLQPHLGATLVILSIWGAISIAAGVRWRYLLGTVGLVAIVLATAITVPGILRDYQRDRVRAMFVKDEKGSDYQAFRAAIAFGVGGVAGTGYGKGEQKAGGFIPEQHNDFIFTVVGEEGGLMVGTLVLGAFGFLFLRMWLAMVRSTDPYPRMLMAGSLALLGFHTLVNLGMNLQILPVVGLWLPFLSSGGTALWLCLAVAGLALNLSRPERPRPF